MLNKESSATTSNHEAIDTPRAGKQSKLANFLQKVIPPRMMPGYVRVVDVAVSTEHSSFLPSEAPNYSTGSRSNRFLPCKRPLMKQRVLRRHGKTCLAIASMTPLYVGPVISNSRCIHEIVEVHTTIGQSEAAKPIEKL